MGSVLGRGMSGVCRGISLGELEVGVMQGWLWR